MGASLSTRIGSVNLKNPVLAGSGEHLIDRERILRALQAGAGAVVVKSSSELQAARDQLQRAEYIALDEHWRPTVWGPSAPMVTTIACRSGLSPLGFEQWLEQTRDLDREARAFDAYAVASLILADLDAAVGLARQIEQAGIRILEFNIGTPYAKQAAKGAVSTEVEPERVRAIVSAIRSAVNLPLWIKITGQSERVPELAQAAFEAGADFVVMAGRHLGFIPDIDTFEPILGTSLGIGGYWNLPLTCHWLALSRATLGKDRPLIGTNGAQSGLDVARMMLAGASAVEMSSNVMMRGFDTISTALQELEDFLSSKNMMAEDLIGVAADRRKTFAEMSLCTDNWRNYIPV